jgi:hypothetical protein
VPKIFDSLTQSDYLDDGAEHPHGHLEAVVWLDGQTLVHFWRDSTPLGGGSHWHPPPGGINDPVCDKNVAGPASLIQSSFRDDGDPHGHLELVVPLANPDGTSDLWHFWRGSDSRWNRSSGPVAKNVAGPGSLIQSDWTDDGGHGHLEVVVPIANSSGSIDLRHFWRDSALAWHESSGFVAQNVAGPGSLIQSTNSSDGQHGNLEVVVPIKSAQGSLDLWHFWRDGSLVWQSAGMVVENVSGPGSLIQSDFTDGGNSDGHLEVVVPMRRSLVHFWRDSGGVWHRARTITDSANGWASFIRSDFGSGDHRNFEVLVEECSASVVSYWRENYDPGLPWLREETVVFEPPPERHLRTRKISQLTGDFDLDGWDGVDPATRRPTFNQTQSRSKIRGTDLGSSFEHQGRTFFLFGDTFRPDVPGMETDFDAIAWTDDASPRVANNPFADGLTLNFYPGPPIVPGMDQGAFNVPLEGFSDGEDMFVFFSTGHQDVSNKALMGFSVLTRCVDTRAVDHLEFTPLQPIFSGDKFINVSVVQGKLDGPEADVLGFRPDTDVLWIWGSGRYRSSDIYLAALELEGVQRNPLDLRFFAGNGAWSNREDDAIPLFCSGSVGELSVRWNPFLERYLCFFNSANPRGILMHSAPKPYGPWSRRPVMVFDAWPDKGYSHFMHAPPAPGKPPFDHNQDDMGRDRDAWGGEYGPYQIARYATRDGDGTHIFFTMSTWNPYQVMLMRTTVTPLDVPIEDSQPKRRDYLGHADNPLDRPEQRQPVDTSHARGHAQDPADRPLERPER